MVKNRVQNEEDVAKVIHEFEESIKNKKQTNKQTNEKHSMASLPPSRSCKCYLMNTNVS